MSDMRLQPIPRRQNGSRRPKRLRRPPHPHPPRPRREPKASGQGNRRRRLGVTLEEGTRAIGTHHGCAQRRNSRRRRSITNRCRHPNRNHPARSSTRNTSSPSASPRSPWPTTYRNCDDHDGHQPASSDGRTRPSPPKWPLSSSPPHSTPPPIPPYRTPSKPVGSHRDTLS